MIAELDFKNKKTNIKEFLEAIIVKLSDKVLDLFKKKLKKVLIHVLYYLMNMEIILYI